MSISCFACKRPLSNEGSIRAGIGPVCLAKRRREESAQEKLDREVSQCHFGLNCGAPGHVYTLLARLKNFMDSWPVWYTNQDHLFAEAAGIPPECTEINASIQKEIETITQALGIDRPPVNIPDVEHASLEEMLVATGHHLNPVNSVGDNIFRIPVNISSQYLQMKMREQCICPHGLDCQDPEASVKAIYRILSTLTNRVDPMFWNTDVGGLVGCDDRSFVHCANMLEVLGLEDEGSFILNEDIPRMQRQAKKRVKRYWKSFNRYSRGLN